MPINYETRSRNVTAVLGPTNTGKTHLAIERMLGHNSGLIGLPLRLLAREVYDKIVARVGVDKVALVTGEEKIKPEGAPTVASIRDAASGRTASATRSAIMSIGGIGGSRRSVPSSAAVTNSRHSSSTVFAAAELTPRPRRSGRRVGRRRARGRRGAPSAARGHAVSIRR